MLKTGFSYRIYPEDRCGVASKFFIQGLYGD